MPRIPLIAAALVSGSIGVYAVIHSLASTPASGGVISFARTATGTNADFTDVAGNAQHYQFVVVQSWRTDVLAELKAANPAIKVLAYYNLTGMSAPSSGVYSGCVDPTNAPEAYFLHNLSGQRFNFSDYTYIWAANQGNSAYQQACANHIVSDLTSKGFDGAMLDDTNYSIQYHYTPSQVQEYPTDAQYGAATKSAVAYIGPKVQAAGKLILPNMGGTYAENADFNDSLLQYVSGAYDEFFTSWPGGGLQPDSNRERAMQSIATAESEGKYYVANTVGSSATDTKTATYGLASEMLVANGHASFGFSAGDYASDLWLPMFDTAKTLGAPKAAYYMTGSVQRRDFANGTVLANPTTATQTVSLGGTYSGSGLNNVTSVTMPAQTGLILQSNASPPPDTTKPVVSLTAPAVGASVSGQVSLAATSSDNVAVTKVEFYADNTLVGTDTAAPYAATWNAASAASGSHTITVKAYDAAGNIGTVSVSVSIQAQSPTITAAPKIYGINNAAGWGGIAAARQQLGVNGDRDCQDAVDLNSVLSQEAAQSMYFTLCVNTDEGLTSLNQHAQDYANLVATEASTYGPGGTYWSSRPQSAQYAIRNFELMNEPYGWWYRNGDNDPASYAHIAVAAIKAGKAANPQAKFYIPLATGDVELANGTWVNWNQALLQAEPSLFSLADGFSIHIYDTPTNFASTLDQTKSWAWSQVGGNGKPFIITEANLTDQQASPEADYVSAIPQFVQIAHDRDWVQELDIFAWHGFTGRDYLGFLDTNGNPRPARIQAYHDAIQQATSTTAMPPPADTTKPTVGFSSPTNNSTVSAIVTATASASDNVGVSKVEFYPDGATTPAMTDTAAPYNYSFDSRSLGNGSHTLLAKAYDAAGNTSSSTVTFTVSNPDITPPSTPANFKATATNATTVNLTWNASTDSGTGATGVAKYNVLRNGTVIAQPAGTSYTDNSTMANTAYTYTVQAVDGAGNVSGNSTAAGVTTPGAVDTTVPTTPTGLSATAVSTSQVNLAWNASTDSGGSGLAGYNVYRNGTKLNSSLVATASYGDIAAAGGTTYSYQVEAVDGAGNKSAKTSSVSATTPAVVKGDITGPGGVPDGKIDLQDISYEIRNYNTTNTAGDVSGPSGVPDGKIDIYDLSYLIRNYGK